MFGEVGVSGDYPRNIGGLRVKTIPFCASRRALSSDVKKIRGTRPGRQKKPFWFWWGLNPRCPRSLKRVEEQMSCHTHNYKHGALTTMLQNRDFKVDRPKLTYKPFQREAASGSRDLKWFCMGTTSTFLQLYPFYFYSRALRRLFRWRK